jgi:hypothetical protein
MAAACVLIFCRWAIGLAFAVSAIGKVTSLTSFQSTIAELGLLPRHLAGPAAIASVTAEALAAAGMAVGGVLVGASFSLASALLAAFSVVLAAALHQKANVSCNCFGPSERRISRYDLLRNGLLGLCCAGGLWAWSTPPAQHPGPALQVTLGLIAAAFLVIATNLEDFVGVLRKPYLAG